MKKLFALIIFSVFLLASVMVFAAGTVTQTWKQYGRDVTVVTFTCTADSVDNSYPATATNREINGFVFLVITNPDDTTAPTDDYDITLVDADGVDIMGGELVDRDNTNSEQAVPLIDAVYGSRWVTGIFTVTPTGNSVASAVFVMQVFIYQ